MKTYAETQTDRMPPEELVLFRRIRDAVNRLPDDPGLRTNPHGRTVLSCHILARAVAMVFGLKCVDGFFHPTFSHSWLVTPSGNIVDVYPVGIVGGPIFLDRIHQARDPDCYLKHGRPAIGLYVPRSARRISRGVGFGTPWFRSSVRRMATLLRQSGRQP